MTARRTPPVRRVVHLGHLPLREVPRAGPCLGLVAHDGAQAPERRTLRREDLYNARAALDFPVDALLHVVGVQALLVRRREVKVPERVGLRLLERTCRPRAAPFQHPCRCHDEGPVHALIALEDVLEEEVPSPELGDS